MASRQESSEFDDYCEDEYDDEDDDFYEEDDQKPMDVAEDKDDDLVVKCLSAAELIQTQIQAIEEVNQIFEISPGTARLLLASVNWDKERLLEKYYSGDQDELFAQAHAVNPHKLPQQPQQPQAEELSCEICTCDYPAKELTGLDCGHRYCESCWNMYLRGKIVGDGVTATAVIPCPAPGCDILVDELTVTRLIVDQALLRKYQYLVAKAFVSGNKHIKWCPANGCDNAVMLNSTKSTPVTCNCGNTFCFKCTQAWHEPILCEMLAHWLKKCSDDSETSNWLAANTKPCPKCKATIEKNGGCNHMTCRTGTCKYEFCWVCGGPWEPHGSSWYNCNRFDEKESLDARDAQSRSRMTLERYLFFFNRYMNHEQSKRLERKLLQTVERKMDEWQTTVPNCTWQDVKFLQQALEVLSECRSVLKYTYVFAYYLDKSNHSEIFESNQKDLEMATETLSGYLEGGDAASDSFQNVRQKVIDKVAYCKLRRQVLIDHVREGQQKSFWTYQPPEMQKLMASVVV